MWKIIQDNKVRHNYECPECGVESTIYPWAYEDIGTPACAECNCDMVYNYTEVEVDNG